jgi:large subunit ribosomal protein L7/L12
MKWATDIIEIGDQIASLSASKAAQLLKYLDETYGISAQASIAIVREPDKVIHQPPTEPTAFNVVLVGFDPAKRIGVIRTVRENTGLGLKEARDFLDGLPKIIGEGLPNPDIEKLKALFVDAGATVTVKPVAE